MPVPIAMALHDQRSHATPDHLELTNAVMPLTIASESQDAIVSINVSHNQKVMMHLILIILTRQMAICAIDDTDAGASGIT